MNEIDYDALLTARTQGRIFELSLNETGSTPIFIRRYMNSLAAARMDSRFFLNTSESEEDVIEDLNLQYGQSNFGKEKYSNEELYWIGYIYRIWAYAYNMRSEEIYRICNGSEMRKLYHLYHSLDPMQAIERILEARNYQPPDSLFQKTQEIIYEEYGH